MYIYNYICNKMYYCCYYNYYYYRIINYVILLEMNGF